MHTERHTVTHATFFIVRVQARLAEIARLQEFQKYKIRARESAVSESGAKQSLQVAAFSAGCQMELLCTACRTSHSGAIGEPSEIRPDTLLLGMFSQCTAELGDNACMVLRRD